MLAVFVLGSAWVVLIYYAYVATLGCLVTSAAVEEGVSSDAQGDATVNDCELQSVTSEVNDEDQVGMEPKHAMLHKLLQYMLEPTHSPVLRDGLNPIEIEEGEVWLQRHWFFVASGGGLRTGLQRR